MFAGTPPLVTISLNLQMSDITSRIWLQNNYMHFNLTDCIFTEEGSIRVELWKWSSGMAEL